MVFELIDRAGVEALSDLRRMPRMRDIPVIAITNPLFETFEEDANGCAAHLAKPFDLGQLLRLLTLLKPGRMTRH